jgi:tetratricopeptide (TPR) repeat protein
MVKKINMRLLFTTLAVFGVLAPSVYFVHAWQVEANADRLKERAEAAEAEGEYVKAFQWYGQYLNFRQNDFDTKLYYLRWRDGFATSREAYERVLLSYEELLRRDPNRPDEAEIRQDIIAVAMTIGDSPLAMHHLEILLKDEKFQDSPELKFQFAQSLQADGRTKEAFETYLEILEDSPGEPKYYVPLAYLFEDQWRNLPYAPEQDSETPLEQEPDTEQKTESDQNANSPEQESVAISFAEKIKRLLPKKNERDFPGGENAEQILEMMVVRLNSAEAFLTRARYRHLRNRLAEARQDVETARGMDADSPSLLIISAELAVAQAQDARERIDRDKYPSFIGLAREDAASGRAQNPNDARFPLLQFLTEEEARAGLGLNPKTDEKQGDPEQDPLKQQEWVLLQKTEEILKEGLDVAKNASAEIESQKPVRTSQRNQEKNPLPNRFQLSSIITRLRSSLADTLISEHQLVKNNPSSTANQLPSAESLNAEVNELIAQLKKSRETGLSDYLSARLLMVEGEWKEAAWTLEQTRVRLTGRTDYIHRIDLLLDECYEKVGNPDKRVEVAERALRETPNWRPAIFRLPY